VAVAQLRVGVSTLTADTRQPALRSGRQRRLPRPPSRTFYSTARPTRGRDITGGALSPTLGEVFDHDALDIWSYLQEEGLVPPDEEERWKKAGARTFMTNWDYLSKQRVKEKEIGVSDIMKNPIGAR